MSSNSSNSVFIHGPELDVGGYPESCPFNTRRAGMTRRKAMSMGLLGEDAGREVSPVRATRAQLETFHSPEYLDAIKAAETGILPLSSFEMGIGTPDCPVFAGMSNYFSLACGGSLTAAGLLLAGSARVAFNPSGGFHHAGRSNAAGFCFLNDIVLATLLMTSARKRVCILDIDAHHSDGVQAAFYDRRDVMTISLHESGTTLFPGTGFENETGTGEGTGFSVNVPLPSGTYDEAYLLAFNDLVRPLIAAYSPDVLIMQLGMDSLAGDPLAHLRLTNNVYADIIEYVMTLKTPILATGGGGYHVENTVRGWTMVWSILCGSAKDSREVGMGGVMLENTDWAGGLRDRTLPVDERERNAIMMETKSVIARVRSSIFPYHCL